MFLFINNRYNFTNLIKKLTSNIVKIDTKYIYIF